MRPCPSMKAALAGVLLCALCAGARAAVYQCSNAAGELLLTDAQCPPGYTTDLIVADPPAPADGSGLAMSRQAEIDARQREAAGVEAARREAEREAAHLRAELEAARLRAELDRERLRAIDRKLDALLDAPPSYGVLGVVPLGVVPKPFPVCTGKQDQTPWVNCRPHPAPAQRKVVPDERPFCGIVGCAPGITRGP